MRNCCIPADYPSAMYTLVALSTVLPVRVPEIYELGKVNFFCGITETEKQYTV